MRGELRRLGLRLLGPFRPSLPYGPDNPVVYDKDGVVNCYTDDYLMALASAGRIRLVGMITSTTVAPFNRFVTAEDAERMRADRIESVRLARESGFRGIPDPVEGPMGHLERPASGLPRDTRPLDTRGSRLIVREALRADPERPLVLVMAGPLTVAADAWLLEPEVAERCVVAWFGGTPGGMADFNGWSDPWAGFIVGRRFRVVQFPAQGTRRRMVPIVPKERLPRLPPSPLREWMVAKRTDGGQPGNVDADAPPAISLTRPDYVRRIRRASVSGWMEHRERPVPAYRPDRRGNLRVVVRADRRIATEEWWRALADPRAYDGAAVGEDAREEEEGRGDGANVDAGGERRRRSMGG